MSSKVRISETIKHVIRHILSDININLIIERLTGKTFMESYCRKRIEHEMMFI